MTRGDCYEANARWMMDEHTFRDAVDELVLVHAEVNGQDELDGETLGHAWIENLTTGYVLDFSNGREVYFPIPLYREVAGVEEIENEYRYTWKEARAWIVGSGTWGPWELETDQ